MTGPEPTPQLPPAPADTEERGEDALDESLEESFPASDPPEQTQR